MDDSLDRDHLDRCAVTPYGRNAGSSRVRVFEWLDRTELRFTVSSYLSLRNARPAQLARRPVALARAERQLREMAAARPRRLLLHREASPLSRGGTERRLLARSEFAVYDFDDALQWDYGSGGLLRRLAPKAGKARVAVRYADRVIAGNAVLADWASQHHRDVVVIPSCVAPEAYVRKTSYHLHDPPRLGWIGSPDNEAHLLLVEDALVEVHRRTGARLTIIGTTRPTLGRLESFTDRVEWTTARQRTAPAEVDIGIMPVPDTAYSRGKCGYKLLQYGAAGLPAVASPVGVNAEILSLFAMPAPPHAEDWTDAILSLLDSPVSTRERLGRQAHEITCRRYSYDAWLPRWESAVETAAVRR
ncbi:glycosyltransferase family 4 protein [Streptomyces sp. ISL-98]|uniref:glycosyltransferase family 4 protein n=1 Tax=Streptomyces sp. ISL-98 TaxID=2819192 RepID=UPI001BEAF8DD|nr:glycosyltransferase family 4 protein [Streptomyces sp. ISL-98]MBT2508909.1 glycosyltransferase family 4 protein [Streptomyces sp. ISL-98]